MKYFVVFFSLLFLLIVAGVVGYSGDQPANAKSTGASPEAAVKKTERVYPIAPGIWYPGQPMPEKPIRYYRIRCWPGCHSGSNYGKYPDKALKMKPIYQTSTIRAHE